MYFERLIAYRYLRSPRQEGFISVIAGFSFLGIALGVATLIIVMSVMNGFRHELLGRILGLNGHLGVYGVEGNIKDFDQMATKIRKVYGVRSVTPIIERQAMVTYRSIAMGAVIHGMRAEDLKKREMISTNIKVGTLDEFGKDGEKTDTIAIGSRMAERLRLTIGSRLTILTPEGNATAFGTLPKMRAFKIVAVFEVGMHDYDNGVIFMPLAAAQQFFKLPPDSVTNIEVFVANPERASGFGFLMQTLLGDKVRIMDWQHSNAKLFGAVQVERNVMFLILSLIIMIAAFNIISSLIMLVKDKTRDIAILRTMGATRTSILRLFFITGSSIGVIGTLSGVALGLSFALNIETIRQWIQALIGAELFNAEIYFLTQMPAKVDWNEVISVILMALGLSFLATLYPSWRAARLDPVEALRQ